jgi:hypothetical protein
MRLGGGFAKARCRHVAYGGVARVNQRGEALQAD